MQRKFVVSVLALLFGVSAIHAEAPSGFIKDWLICGPFPNPPNKPAEEGKPHVYDHTHPCIGLDSDYLTEHGGEAKIEPKPGMTHTKKDGSKVTWTKHTSPVNKVVFRKAITRTPNVVAYAFRKFRAAAAGPYILALGSDEGVCVWVNGKKVHYNLIQRPIAADEDLIPVNLKKGENSILIKVEQGHGGWGFILRILGASDNLVEFEKDYHRLEIRASLLMPSSKNRQELVLTKSKKEVGRGVLIKGKDGLARAEVTFPFPAAGSEYGTLDLVLSGKAVSSVEVPELAEERRHVFTRAGILARPGFVFSGNELPELELERPVWAKALVGPSELKTKYYNSEYEEVAVADKAGRYGAVVEIKSGEHVDHRYLTLFRCEGDVEWWWDCKWDSLAATLPEATGIDPMVVKKQSAAVVGHLKSCFLSQFSTGSGDLFAGLYESAGDDPEWVRRTSPHAISAEWWTGLKVKLGHEILQYRVDVPRDYAGNKKKKWPLLLFLHGRGGRGEGVEKLAFSVPAVVAKNKGLPFIVVSPRCPRTRWEWEPSELGVVLDEVIRDYRVDENRVYCTGASMGGLGTWTLAMAYPDRFAAIVPICGGGDERDVARIKDMPTWVFHSSGDQTVPLSCSQEMVDAMKAKGANPKFTIYPSPYHDCWTITYNNPKLYEWLLEHRLQ